MKLVLKLFVVVMLIYFLANGVSLLIRQKDFDLIGWLFYPKEYRDISVWDLTDAPYWVSVFMALLYFLPVVWGLVQYLKYKSEYK